MAGVEEGKKGAGVWFFLTWLMGGLSRWCFVLIDWEESCVIWLES